MIDEDIAIKEIKKFFWLDDEEVEDYEIEEENYSSMIIKVAEMEIEIYQDYDVAEEYAVEVLTSDDYFWREAVKEGNTIEGLYDWAKDIVRYDGLNSIAFYDGDWHEGKDYVYVRRN